MAAQDLLLEAAQRRPHGGNLRHEVDAIAVVLDLEVKAFVSTHLPNARAAADASTERYRKGRPLSPVDGLPIGIKDVFETQDMPTQMNSPLFSDWHTGRDSVHVYVLRRAGALIVGKTVTTEFAQATPGPTRNPFDLTRTPGGSSSGSCAAVGAGMLPVATGSQVRGSIIRPAGYCGNYALKPTFGALNQQGAAGRAIVDTSRLRGGDKFLECRD
jgi:Asp-tRNA(Asn)/Glu-tRNA(Gln) amidotransferase A subunit family amidase